MMKTATKNRRSHATSVLIGCAVMLTSVGAQAQGREDAREYRQIEQLSEEHPDEALQRCLALHQRNQSPRALAMAGILEGQLGRWILAETHLRQALAATDDRWIRRNRRDLEENLRTIEEHVSELTITSNVPGAVLRVNGTEEGLLPLSHPVRVAAGEVIVDLTLEGYEPLRQRIQATPPRSRAELTMVQRAVIPVTETRAAEAVRTETPVSTTVPTAPIPDAQRATSPTQPQSSSTLRTLGLVGLVAGGVGLGVGFLGIALRNASVGTFTQQGCWLDSGTVRGGGDCQPEYDRGDGMQTLSAVGFVTGGVFAAVGATLLIVAPRGSSRERQATLSCGWGPGSVGVGCAGSF